MLGFIAEQRIAEAIANGELDDLPGTGKALELDDDALVPEELRVAYRILKNAGVAPPEVRKLELMKARVERRYYRKVAARLGRLGRY
jgi:hypothetical protein